MSSIVALEPLCYRRTNLRTLLLGGLETRGDHGLAPTCRLCGRALAAVDEHEIRQALTELRSVLHEHIEQLRSGLITAYVGGNVRAVRELGARENVRQHATAAPSRTWQQIVHQIASEGDHDRAVQLSMDLTRLLRESFGPGM